MNTIQALEEKLAAKREAYKTATDDQRIELWKDATIIKVQIRALQKAKEVRSAPRTPLFTNDCTHPISMRRTYKDGSESCEECTTLFPKT